MTPEEFKKRLKTLKKGFKNLMEKEAPRIAGQTAVALFKKNFQEEAFFGSRWKEVKRREDVEINYKTKTGKLKTKTVKRGKGASGRRKILTGSTGALGRSIKFKIGAKSVLIYTDVKAFGSREPYGRVHNEGLRAGRGKGFKMPKRQFMGAHDELRKSIIQELERKLSEIKN